MFSHVALGADDIEAARRFYDAALGALGVPPGTVDAWGRLIYAHAGGRFLITKPLNGEAAHGANGGTLGFAAPALCQASTASVDAAANGGTMIEDPPGIRHGTEGRQLYLAYLRDPAGNKLCATHRVA